MTREALTNILPPILILTAMFFFYRKVYYHFKFLGLHDQKLKDKSILGLLFNPLTLLEHFYILIPIFIKSDRKKKGDELILETKIENSIRSFWILFVLTLVIGIMLTAGQSRHA